MKMELRHLMILGGMGTALGVTSMAVANDPIVFDNIPAGYNMNTAMSSQFDSNYPFDSQTADDFVIGGGVDTFVTGVNWWGSFFNGPAAPVSAFNILIYADAGGVPTGGPNDPSGTALASYTLLPGEWSEVDIDGNDFEYSAKLPASFTATAGETYWLAVQAVMFFPPQWGIDQSAGVQGSNNVIGFPLLGIPYWSDGAAVFGVKLDDAFQLTGVPVPAPGALALLGIAGVAGMRRRRRK